MFKIIVLIIFLLFIYAALKRERRNARILIFIYFTSVSIIFITGISYISTKYHLYQAPVLDGGFKSLYKWVSGFSYLYIIPTLLIIACKIFRVIQNSFDNTWIRVIMYVLCLVGLAGIGYVSFFIFILTFYGFAP